MKKNKNKIKKPRKFQPTRLLPDHSWETGRNRWTPWQRLDYPGGYIVSNYVIFFLLIFRKILIVRAALQAGAGLKPADKTPSQAAWSCLTRPGLHWISPPFTNCQDRAWLVHGELAGLPGQWPGRRLSGRPWRLPPAIRSSLWMSCSSKCPLQHLKQQDLCALRKYETFSFDFDITNSIF